MEIREIIAELKQAGARSGRKYNTRSLPAREAPEPAVALARATALLETSGTRFFEASGCVSCHHQNMVVRAQAAAKAAGIPINEATVKEQALQMKTQWIPLQDDFLQGILPGGGANRLAENLLGLKAGELWAGQYNGCRCRCDSERAGNGWLMELKRSAAQAADWGKVVCVHSAVHPRVAGLSDSCTRRGIRAPDLPRPRVADEDNALLLAEITPCGCGD